MINTKEKKKVGRMSRFLRFCAFLSVVFFTSNLMAAGYTCSPNPTYISCEVGYYLSDCDGDTSWKGQTISPSSGNSCNLCPAGYECAGGNVCPNSSAISCDAGTYIKANTTTCTACPAGSYCPGITGSGGSTASDRGITKCPSGYQDGTDTGSKLESDCVMKVEAGKYVKTAKGSSASTCASGTYKGAHTVNYGQTSTCVSCPNNYPGSVAGAESIVSCYATCQPGTAVFTVQQPCKTQAGAWYTSEEHNVYYGSISNVSYCPIDSASELQGTTSASHDSQDDCKVEVKAGYGSTVTTAVAQYIRISSTTGVFPLAEIRVSNATDGPLTLAPGSGMTNAAGALDSNLGTQAVVNVLSGSMYYAIFDLNEQRSIDTIAFALGSSGTVGFEIKIEMSNDKTLWTTVFDSTVFGVSKLPGVFQYVNVNSRTYDECSGGTYNEATVVVASEPVECTACPKAACTGATDCASGYTTHMTEYPANFHSGENLKLVKAWFPESANKGNTSIEECKLSYSFTNNRGSFSQDALRYNSTTGRYGGAGGGVVYYTALKSGYYGSGKLTDTYCDTNPDVRRQMYQDAVVCPAGSYCVGYSQMPLCSSGTYNDTIGITGKVDAGYYSTGGGTSATPIASGDGCLSSEECGSIAPGYWGVAGETKSTGSGAVSAGYYSTYGGTSATPSGFQNGCVGYDGNSNPTCGPVAAGYYSTGGGTAANGKCLSGYNCGMTTPGYYSTGGAVTNVPSADDCVGANDCGTIAAGYWGVQGAETSMGSGTVNAGYYSTGGATTPAPTEDACVGANDCGIVGAGYYSTGGGTSANGTCLDAYDCGQVDAGYYSTGGGTSAAPVAAGNGCLNGKQCGVVDAGYYATGGATSAQGHGIIKLGLYSTCGATSEGGSNVASSDYLECVDGCECGRVAAGYYSTGGGTSARPTAADNGCLSGESCGTMAAGYYSRGGAGSANASGYYCWGYNEYSDGVNGCGQVGAGYWNNGGGTDVNGTCVSGKSCGLISAGYYGNAGATTSTGAGEVNGGFFSTGGGKTATPASNSDCAGDGTTCGKIAAGYWSYRGGKTATPTSSADCTMGYCGVIRGGYYSTCGGIEEYATEGSVNSCADGCECGPINPGYYSTGCSISDDGAVCDTSKYTVGEIAAGYYSDGGSNTPQGDGLLAAGYFSTGGATVRKPTSADCVGSNTCGTVNAGYYVSGGGTLAAPVAFGNGCVGQWKDSAGEMVNHACGKVGAGYWNNGGGTDVNGTCVSDKSCGLIDAGYYGNAGATSSTGAGTVWPGHFSTGGATKQKPTEADCVGDNTCGLVAAGYWTSHGGKTATPTTAETDCVNKACGKIAAGYFSTGGATRSNPTEVGNHCFGTSCGLLGAGYYSSGGGTSATPTAVGDGCLTGFVCGGCPTGYDDNTAQGKTAVDQCKISCAAGTRVAARNAACTSPAGGWFSAATLTSYGNVSPVSYCMDGYTSTSTSASGHDAVTDCVQTIDGGKYVPSSTINARYVKLTGNLENSANNYGVHVVEMQAFASNDGTGTNLMADSTSDKTTDDEWTTSSHVSISTAKTWDLGSVQSLGSLKFALYPGRTYYNVAIYVSEDNTNWTTVFGPQDVLTQSISPLVGEVVVLSAAPKSCAVGTYKASGSLALTNTSSCSMAQAGYFVGTTGASSQTKCVIGSYTDTTGQSACKACAGGKTTSAAGATSCAATCSNATGVASTGWETPVWGTDNKMTNLCTIKATAGCSANYYKNSNACSTCASGTNSKYTLSAAGTTTVNNCYLNTTAKNFVKTAGAGQTTCEKGNYCPGSVKVYYGGTASDTHPTTGGSTQCPANSYCVAGVSAATACSTLGGGLYKNSTAGASAAEDCNFTTTAGKYMVANTDTAQTTCPGKQYCEAETLNWPNVSVLNNGGWNDCPDAATHKRTSFPADYYSPTITSTTLANSTGKTSMAGCTVLNWMDSATHGGLYEYVTFNTTTNLYDKTTTYRWYSTKPGYYLTDKNGCGAYAYYETIKECEAGSYCPGKERVSCNSSNQATVHTDTFGLNSCSADTDGNYELSSGGVAANSINACYLKTNVGDWVATANAAQTDCQANGYCVGNATVYYGSTGGRTACVAPYGLAAAGSDDANDCYLKTTAGQYVQTAGAGQITCPAGYWCVGNVAIYKGGSVTGRSTTGGSEQCPAGYRDGTTGYSLQSQCTMNVAGGKYVAAANESSASGTCALGTYKPAHTVTYGKTSSCSACTGATYADQEGMSACEACPTATEYADKVVAYYSNRKSRSGCYARFKEEVANGETTYFNCYLRSGDDYGTLTSGNNCWTHGARTKCDAGYYSPVVPTPDYDEMWYANLESVVNNICQPVESGYWSGADSLTRTACETGLVTCGEGLCANEAGDCGRKLHAGDNVIYLRSEKRTGVSPLLHVKMKMEDASGEEVDRLFYGNMSTTLSGPLKVKYNNTKYSVVNDNQ